MAGKYPPIRGGDQVDGRQEYIYFVRSPSTGNIKIGFTTKLWKRVGELQKCCGEELELRIHIAGENLKAEKARLHTVFAEARLHGEWFSPTPKLLGLIDHLRASMEPSALEHYDCCKTMLCLDPPKTRIPTKGRRPGSPLLSLGGKYE